MSKATMQSLLGFTGRVIVAHFLTYFFLGFLFYILGINVLVFYEQNPDPFVTVLHRPTSSLLVQAGPLFQPIRAAIFGLALFPFRRVFLETKRGWLYLWGLFLALAIFAPAGEMPGSIEGFVYTNAPVLFHAIYLPEIVLQTLAFSWLLVTWEHHKVRKVTIPLVVAFFAILIVSIAGLLTA